jgi:hypothetical protein
MLAGSLNVIACKWIAEFMDINFCQVVELY